ncbi:hypothetical protein ACFV3R_22775 [Streptomyces sp. NPDC059740]|uniref:hypothetical protein n=1 Tax=Streptomyces sp. NPDC059740 TaxID=3346926 RepID=UPI00365D1A1F
MTSPAESNPVPEAAEAAATAPRGRLRGRTVGTAVLTLAVVAGLTCTGVTVAHAGHTAKGPRWVLPRPAGATAPAPGPTGRGDRSVAALERMLLPYDAGRLDRGPDIKGYGSDLALTGEQATKAMRRQAADLPRGLRELVEKHAEDYGWKGLVARSYLAGATDDRFTLALTLQRGTSAAAITRSTTGVLDHVPVLRHARVPGHPAAHCYLMPLTDGEDAGGLDGMLCLAYEREVMVRGVFVGGRPLDADTATSVLAEQLDHLTAEGRTI